MIQFFYVFYFLLLYISKNKATKLKKRQEGKKRKRQKIIQRKHTLGVFFSFVSLALLRCCLRLCDVYRLCVKEKERTKRAEGEDRKKLARRKKNSLFLVPFFNLSRSTSLALKTRTLPLPSFVLIVYRRNETSILSLSIWVKKGGRWMKKKSQCVF